MKIAVWSEEDNRSLYECFLGVAAMSSMISTEKVVAMQGGCPSYKVDYGLSSAKLSSVMMEDYGYYNRRGIDRIMDSAINCELTVEQFWDNLIHVPKSNLFFLPSSRKCVDEILYEDLKCSIEYIFRILSKMKEKVFVSAECGYNDISEKIINKADKILICIDQNSQPISKKIICDKKIMDKSVFVVLDYDSYSRYNIGNIKRKYSISSDRIFYIPQNKRFKDSVYSGKTFDFIRKYFNVKPNHDNYEIIYMLQKMSRAICC